MSANVTSHRRPIGAWAWLALIAALFALMLATWLDPSPDDAAPPPRSPSITRAPEPTQAPVATEATPETARQPPLARRARGVPLDADASGVSDDFEVLSAAELDAISQDGD